MKVPHVWQYLFEECRWRSKTLWQIGRIAVVHAQALLARDAYIVDVGLSFERERGPDGHFVRRKRTQVRICGLDNLLKTHPWVSGMEEEIFLLGFDQGELFAQKNSK